MIHRLFRAVLIVLFLATSITARAQWRSLDSSFPRTLNLAFTADEIGYAAGDQLLKTTNGGLSFFALPLPAGVTHPALRTMSWPTPNIGYVAGEIQNDKGDYLGVMLKTTNAGASWTKLSRDSNYLVWQIAFPSADTGYAIEGTTSNSGNRIVKTIDGGATWKIVIPDSPNSIPTMAFRNNDEGFIAYTSQTDPTGIQVRFTSDGLATTSIRMNGINPTMVSSLFSFTPTDDNAWLASIDGHLYRTIDLGGNWIKIPISNEPYLQSLSMKQNVAFEYSIAITPIMNLSTDFGLTWQYTILPDSGGYVKTMSSPSKSVSYAIVYSGAKGTGYQLIKWKGVQSVGNDPANAKGLAVHYTQSDVNLTYSASARSRTLQLFDLLGRPTKAFAIAPGSHSISIPISQIEPGVYFARLERASVKMIIGR